MQKINKKPTVIIITPYFPPHSGGVQNYVDNIAKELQKQYNYTIVIITTNIKKKKIEIEIKNNIRIYRLPILFTLSNTPINPSWYFQIKKILQYEKPDIINAHAPVPFIANISALAAGNIPFILTYHTGSMKKGKFFVDIFISIYEKFVLPQLFNKANKIICSSQFVRTTIPKKYIKKAFVITPAVDISVFKPGIKKIASKPTILFICRHANMYRLKGLYTLLTAMDKLPNITLKVIGEKIKSSKKHIKFIGIKKGKKLVKEIQTSDILILPSGQDKESFGTVLLEALACKTPVIGTRGGGIPEAIEDHKDGLLIPANNPEALKNAIETIINNPLLARSMGENGYQKIKKMFTWKNKAKQTRNIFKTVINHHHTLAL